MADRRGDDAKGGGGRGGRGAAGRTILVTGATAGIGRATAIELARRGHTVLAAGRDPGRLAELAAADVGYRGRLIPTTLDVADPESRTACLASLSRDGHRIDVLVNNAGVAVSGPLLDQAPGPLRAMFDVNVFGLLALTQQVVATMLPTGRGRIVNVSSTAGRIAGPLASAYAASKFAVEALSDGLRRELHPLGISVVLVEPGPVHTGFAERSVESAGFDPAGPYRNLIPRIPTLVERSQVGANSPERVAAAIARAALTPRPRPRYLPSAFGRLGLTLTQVLPTRATDAILRRGSLLTPDVLAPPARGEAETSRPGH